MGLGRFRGVPTMMGEEGEEGDASTPQSAGFLEPPAKRGGGAVQLE